MVWYGMVWDVAKDKVSQNLKLSWRFSLIFKTFKTFFYLTVFSHSALFHLRLTKGAISKDLASENSRHFYGIIAKYNRPVTGALRSFQLGT